MQNSGVETWDLNNVRLGYSVLFLDNTQTAPADAMAQIASVALVASPADIIAPGGATYSEFQLPADHFTHGGGSYRMRFDVQVTARTSPTWLRPKRRPRVGPSWNAS